MKGWEGAVLLAFINPSGPTRESQKLSLLLSDIVLISASAHFKEEHSRLRVTFSVGPSTLRARQREALI